MQDRSLGRFHQNGSFEDGYADWTASGNQVIATDDPSHPASDGSKVVVFSLGNTFPSAVLSQTFVTIPGQRYNLAVDLGTVGAIADQQVQLTLQGDDVLFNQVLTVSSPDAGAFYVPQNISFVANSASTTLLFQDVSITYYVIDLLLDFVQITPENAQSPLITSQPLRTAAPTGGSATFSVVASGPGTLDYQWRFSGNNIPGAIGNSLTVKAVDATKAGNYDVVISNAFGSTTSSAATLTVIPPGILLNGSFEYGSAAWTFTGSAAVSTNTNYGTTDGAQLAHFNFGQQPVGGISSQSFATTVGQTYILTFDAGAFSFVNQDEQRMQVTVQGNSTLLSEAISVSAPGNGTHYISQSFVFVADSSITTLSFQDTSLTTLNVDLLLDNVRVTLPPPLQLTAASSRKTHGDAGVFDINLPLAGEPAVECRSGGTGNDYTVVFTFTNNVMSGTASVTSGKGTVSGPPEFVGDTITVSLTGVADVQNLTVTLSNVTDTFSQLLPDATVSVNMLIGDTTGNKTVNSSDISQTKSQSGAPLTNANFRMDVTASGSINTSDISLVKSRSGATLP